MLIRSQDAEREGALSIARLMMVAARTAPKAGGRDSIVTAILDGEDKEKLAGEMERVGRERKLPGRIRDSGNVRGSELVVLIGVKYVEGTSKELKLVDLGIAVSSAAKIAADLNADNRIMRSIGDVADSLRLLEADYSLGIPISISGKSIYFDRPPVTAI